MVMGTVASGLSLVILIGVALTRTKLPRMPLGVETSSQEK